MQLSRTKFKKSFILSTKEWIQCFPGKNPVNSRGKSGYITDWAASALVTVLAVTVLVYYSKPISKLNFSITIQIVVNFSGLKWFKAITTGSKDDR